MKPRVCICCGEPMAEAGHGLSRNPNVCASCSSMADGIAFTGEPEPKPNSRLNQESRRASAADLPDIQVEWISGRIQKHE